MTEDQRPEIECAIPGARAPYDQCLQKLSAQSPRPRTRVSPRPRRNKMDIARCPLRMRHAMNPHNAIAARLSFNTIDEETRRLLRETKDFLVAELPTVLEGFYTHVSKYPETSAFFKNRDHMMGAKHAQIRHWQTILDGNFDSVYEASIMRIGET